MSSPALTVFSTAKPFEGLSAIIQRNAIASWTQLLPRPEVILFGDEPGVAEICKEFGARHVPDVARSESGVPLVNDLFAQAQRLGRGKIVCYANCDIILMSDFTDALRAILEWRRGRAFLASGIRWHVPIVDPMDFASDWEAWVRQLIHEDGEAGGPWGLDYFAFSRGLYDRLPPFVVGRIAWDNWMVYAARAAGAAVVDISPAVKVAHQRHDYDYDSTGWTEVHTGEEAQRNVAIAAGPLPEQSPRTFDLRDATHVVTSRGIERAWRTRGFGRWLKRELFRLPVFHPSLRPPARVARAVYTRLRPARKAGRFQEWWLR